VSPRRTVGETVGTVEKIEYSWRGPLTDRELNELVESHGGHSEPGWWDRVRGHSLGWVTARTAEDVLVGFVNIAWDGCNHAFLLDTKTRGVLQHEGVGTEVVRQAVLHAQRAGCEWLHVDFREELGSFYFDACGFHPTSAGLIRLSSSS
jgi:hypothetical protein